MANYMTEFSPNNDTNVYQVKDKEASPISLLKDTVGWTGKNKAKSYKVETYTEQYYRALNIDVELQPSTSYKLVFTTDNSGNQYFLNTIFEGGDTITADGTQKVITVTTKSTLDTSQYNLANGGWYVLKNYTEQSSAPSFSNVMITDASILNSTFEPYHPSVEECKFDRAEQRVLGAKNWWKLENVNSQGTGVTFTLNSDKTVLLSAGTTSSECYFPGGDGCTMNNLLTDTKYKVSYGDSAVANMKLQVLYKATSSSSWATLAETSDKSEVEFTTPSSYYLIWVRFVIANNKTVSATTLYPMIRLASDPDNTYAPYSHTNKELTDKVTPSAIQTVTLTGGSITGDLEFVKLGNIAQVRSNNLSVTNAQSTITINDALPDSSYRPFVGDLLEGGYAVNNVNDKVCAMRISGTTLNIYRGDGWSVGDNLNFKIHAVYICKG